MSEPSIVEFLLARIAEDEQLARAFVNELGEIKQWRAAEIGGELHQVGPRAFGLPSLLATFGVHAEATFVANYDPARVMAECAAKRAIIKQHEQWPVLVEREPVFSMDAGDMQGATMRMTREVAWLTEREYVKRFGAAPPTAPMIATLAAVHKDHPSYRQEWSL